LKYLSKTSNQIAEIMPKSEMD